MTATYDETTAHGYGIGRLTSERFTGGDANEPLHGSYSYYYGARGEITHFTLTTTAGTGYGLAYTYNDAMQPTSLTYSDGEVFSPQYNSDGWLTAATTTPSGGSQVNLLTNVSYSGTGGAAGHLTGANLGNGTYALTASYDDALQFTSLTLTNVSQGTTVFSTQRGYDPVGVVTSVNTTLANGTDNQVFCYDSLNRLVWAGSTGTPNCARTLTPGTLSAANYTATYSYDASNRITGGSLGTLSYGDSSHFHAATSSTSGETATYDAAGDMRCRAPTSAVTCAGSSQTGASLNYDAERRLTHWQNAQSNPTVQAWYLYDGEGNRVEQYVSGGSGNHTYYLPGGVEEVTPSGSLTKYYSAGGMTIGLNTARDASGISYLASDGLDSVSEALSQSGTATGAALYSPYGGVRYTSGTMPTSRGFTGQYADTASSGLDYYGARYYDPSLGQFTSADTVADGINRYGYVAGNPETATDPTGHRVNCDVGPCGGRPGSKPPPQERDACENEPAICEQILRTFHNSLTFETLLFIAETGSSIGMEILKWILNIGKTLGDSFISWDGKTHGGAGYTDSGGFIHLQDQGNIGENAGALIHEAVEAYYAIHYGVRSQASQQMDYLAQRYTGMFKSQSNGRYSEDNGCDASDNCQFYGAYGLSFQQWRATQDGKGYAGEPLIQAEVQFGTPIAPGYVFYRTGPFGIFLSGKAVHGGSIADLDAAYSELYNPNISSPMPGAIV